VAERSTSTGPGRVVVLVYGVFALAASARAGFQLATQFDEAPVAYLLSAFSAAVYILATIAFARNARRLALVACGIELAGVLVIGTLSLVWRAEFPHATVWSTYGIGYGFVPLVLPVVGLLWLRRTGQPADSSVQ
jgi:hypothetical protein